MVLNCPHCSNHASYVRGDFFGHWVVCPRCESPFAWRDSPADESAADAGEPMRKEARR